MVRTRIFEAGEGGYLYVDLLMALFIVSISLIGLFSGGRSVVNALRIMQTQYRQAVETYETSLLGAGGTSAEASNGQRDSY